MSKGKGWLDNTLGELESKEIRHIVQVRCGNMTLLMCLFTFFFFFFFFEKDVFVYLTLYGLFYLKN